MSITKGSTDNPALNTRLEQNKDETKNNVQAYLGIKASNSTPVIIKPVKLGTDNNLGAAILALEERRDNKQGIVWRRSDPHADGTVDLIRDARNATEPFPDPCPESRAIQVLNLTRAAMHILKVDDKLTTERQNALLEKANKAIDAANKGEAIDPKKSAETIADILAEAGIPVADIPKRLHHTKEFLHIQDQQFHISTITKIGDKVVVESDNMILGLTKIQKNDYELIRDGSGDGVDWYKTLPKYEQDLVKLVAPDILQGKVLPSQLHDDVAGLRNAYAKATSVVKADGHTLETVASTVHMATPSVHNKKFDDKMRSRMTTENIRQLEACVGGKVVINTLSSSSGNSTDVSIVKQVTGAHDQVALTPTNAGRAISKTNLDPYDKMLKALGEKLGSTTHIGKYLSGNYDEHSPEHIQAQFALSTLKKEHYKKFYALRHAIEAKKLMNIGNSSDNVEISARMKLVVSAVKEESGALHQYNNDKISIIASHCKHGMDRTIGAVELATTVLAIADRVVTRTSERIAQTLANGGHSQLQASMNGGAAGTHGANKNTAKTHIGNKVRLAIGASLPKFLRNIKGMYTKTAGSSEKTTTETLKDWVGRKKGMMIGLVARLTRSSSVAKSVTPPTATPTAGKGGGRTHSVTGIG